MICKLYDLPYRLIVIIRCVIALIYFAIVLLTRKLTPFRIVVSAPDINNLLSSVSKCLFSFQCISAIPHTFTFSLFSSLSSRLSFPACNKRLTFQVPKLNGFRIWISNFCLFRTRRLVTSTSVPGSKFHTGSHGLIAAPRWLLTGSKAISPSCFIVLIMMTFSSEFNRLLDSMPLTPI